MINIRAPFIMVLALLAACSSGGFERSEDAVFAPGVSGKSEEDGLVVGHRLMAAGEYELALRAYSRAATQQGLNSETLSAIGSANLRLGRLNQAERWLRQATDETPNDPVAWNNLGVILMEQGKYAEASEVFRRAFATDSGKSDQIRDNLRAALAKLNAASYGEENNNQEVQLVRRGTGDFVLLTAP
ncbi:MAG: tetratricopeptide repeat protein [Pseudomonadota bacterium]